MLLYYLLHILLIKLLSQALLYPGKASLSGWDLDQRLKRGFSLITPINFRAEGAIEAIVLPWEGRFLVPNPMGTPLFGDALINAGWGILIFLMLRLLIAAVP
jgi:hypothetical protein